MTTTVGRTHEPVPSSAHRPARRPYGTAARSGTVRGSASLRSGSVFVLVVAGRAYRALLLTLVAIAILPTVGTWTSYLVRTGSMEPAIHAGDVVIGQPFGSGEKVPVGRVMVFEAPPGSGAGSVLRVHRVVERLDRGGYVTAGDANPTPDAASVPRASFRSRAVIEVPYVGLPLVWMDRGQYPLLVLWLLASTLLLLLSFRRLPDDPPDDAGRWRRARNRAGERLGLRTSRHRDRGPVLRVAVALLSAAAVAAVPAAANAAFTDTTKSGSNTWKAALLLRQAYTSAVMADAPYAFYRLDEASGATAADYAGGIRTGTYTSVAAYRQTGALPKNPGYAIRLAASSGRMVGGGTGLLDPTSFSVELWFRTTTTTGGKLFGFESARDGTSAFYDREIFMVSDGRVVYMGGTSTNRLINTSAPLNDGAWHHLVVTSRSASGSQQDSFLYVDGALADSGPTNKASVYYNGWWRAGFGKLPLLGGMPPSANFTGSIDDVAIYTAVLSSTRVAAHYAAR